MPAVRGERDDPGRGQPEDRHAVDGAERVAEPGVGAGADPLVSMGMFGARWPVVAQAISAGWVLLYFVTGRGVLKFQVRNFRLNAGMCANICAGIALLHHDVGQQRLPLHPDQPTAHLRRLPGDHSLGHHLPPADGVLHPHHRPLPATSRSSATTTATAASIGSNGPWKSPSWRPPP